jgi:hypothetical protein
MAVVKGEMRSYPGNWYLGAGIWGAKAIIESVNLSVCLKQCGQ